MRGSPALLVDGIVPFAAPGQRVLPPVPRRPWRIAGPPSVRQLPPQDVAYRGTTHRSRPRLTVGGAQRGAWQVRAVPSRRPAGHQRRDDHMPQLSREDFEHLLEFRSSLRRFERWSEHQARAAGLTHVQHQLLVAVKGHPGSEPPTVSDLAGYLLLRHHSTVELVDRAETAGLVRRVGDAGDGRLVRVRLTARGERILDDLTPAHLTELHSLAAILHSNFIL